MEFRRTSQRDERRRRVLVDEVSHAGNPNQLAEKSNSTRAPRYADAARSDNQLRITDLIPQRGWTLCGLFALGVAMIGAIEFLYLQLPHWSGVIGHNSLTAIDLTSSSNLGTWFGAFLLAITSVLSLIIFSIRRHRSDDYRGRYNMWVWASGASCLASVDAVTGVRHILAGLLFHVTSVAPLNDIATWWMLVWGLLCAVLSIRIGKDVVASRLATLSLVVAICSYLAAVLIRLNVVVPSGVVATVLFQTGFLLSGHLLLTFSWCLYARYVYLEAEGTLTVQSSARQHKVFRLFRRPAEKADEIAPATAAAGVSNKSLAKSVPLAAERKSPVESHSIPPSSTTSNAQVRSNKSQSSRQSQEQHFDTDGLDLDSPNLSKADRRRLRKQKRKQRDAA